MVKRFLSRMVTCALVAFASFNAGAAEKIRLLFVFDKGAMDYISQAGADYDEFAASCVTRMNTVLTNSRLNDYFTYQLAGTTLLPGVDNTNPATGYTEGWAALCGNRGDEWAEMLNDRYNNAADVVVLLINTGSYAGATGNSHPFTSSGAEYAINYAGSAFSVCSIMTAAREIQGIASGHQVLSHEVAHTLGCGHPDTQDRQPGPQSTSYASGMQFRLPDGKETALPPRASVTQDVTAYYGTTLMGYSERFFKHADGTYMTLAEVLDETGWTDAGEGVMYWDNTDGVYGSSYPNGVWTYCYIVPYFSSPNLYFSNVTVPYGMELTDGVVTVYDQAQYDAMSAEDKAKLVPMGDEKHNNRQVLIDNCQYASRWHLGVKFSKEGNASVVNGKSDKITLTPLSKDLTIYYTTDGTEPTKENGTLYTEPFSLTTAATVKARSYDANDNAGDVLSKSYTMLPLATALGNTELTWTVGDYPWCVEEGEARSRVFASSEAGNQSVLATTIVGPATVNFDYRVWSAGFAMEDYSDKFIVMLDGVEYLSLTDTNVDEWTAIDSIEVPEGGHTLSLVFRLQEYWGDSRAAVRNVSVEKQVEPEPAYEGPKPTAMWISGEFAEEHEGLSITLNDNATNKFGNIVIGDTTTLGATIIIPDGGYDEGALLLKYSIPSGGAPKANCAPATIVVDKEMGAIAGSGLSELDGYYLDGSSLRTGYVFSNPVPSIPHEGYILLSAPAKKSMAGSHYTAVYVGESIEELSGGQADTQGKALRFTGDDRRVTKIGIGGPTAAGANPWAGMVIKGVAVFDQWLAPSDIAGFAFPEPESAIVAPVPVAEWNKDFWRTVDGCTLDRHDNTVGDDGIITIVTDKSGIPSSYEGVYHGVDVNLANPASAITVIVKYSDLNYSTANGRMFFTSCADENGEYDRTALRLTTGNQIKGSASDNTGPATDDNATLTDPPATSGYMVFSYSNEGTSLCGGASEGSLNTDIYCNSGLGFTGDSIYGATVGGYRKYVANPKQMRYNATDMKIEAIAVFNKVLTEEERNAYRFPEPADPIPAIDDGATTAEVAEIVASVPFADDGVAAVINGADDPVEEYKAFKKWADEEIGSAMAVVANQYAAAAYVLGATALFENKPEVEISEAGLDTKTGTMTLTVKVKDGENLKEVASAKVKELFEATSDLRDWLGDSKLTPTVTDLTQGKGTALQFAVKPGDGTSPNAFLRIRK